jgi:hypothetical protein
LKEIGVINSQHGDLLNQLKNEISSVRFEVYVVDDEPSSRKLAGRPLEINIYGNPKHLETIGSTLSTAGVFLQEPNQVSANCKYLNPHVYSVGADSTTPFFRQNDVKEPVELINQVKDIIFAQDLTVRHLDLICGAKVETKLCRLVFWR